MTKIYIPEERMVKAGDTCVVYLRHSPRSTIALTHGKEYEGTIEGAWNGISRKARITDDNGDEILVSEDYGDYVPSPYCVRAYTTPDEFRKRVSDFAVAQRIAAGNRYREELDVIAKDTQDLLTQLDIKCRKLPNVPM